MEHWKDINYNLCAFSGVFSNCLDCWKLHYILHFDTCKLHTCIIIIANPHSHTTQYLIQGVSTIHIIIHTNTVYTHRHCETHRNGRVPVCSALWTASWLCFLNEASQWSHLWGEGSEWTFKCLCRLCSEVYTRLHPWWGHLLGVIEDINTWIYSGVSWFEGMLLLEITII